MTRINVIDPSHLSREHLIAEYRELPRVFSKVLKRQSKGQVPKDIKISSEYILGTGHETFFFDKCLWLLNRYDSIVKEMIERDYNVNFAIVESIHGSVKEIDDCWFNDWTPKVEDMYLNMARIVNRTKIEKVLEEISN